MSSISLTKALRKEYEDFFNSCLIRPDRMGTVEGIINRLQANKAKYDEVERATAVPWFFVGVVHNMESDMDFTTHLHNGDPLTRRTIQVPAGRPRTGHPPFTWPVSAADALQMKGLGAATDWSLAGLLYQLERYNGWGYRQHHTHVLSPYLWSFCFHYTSGKYVADGTWSDTAVSKQCGAAVLLRRMAENGVVQFADQPAPDGESPLVVAYSMRRSSNPAVVARAEELQRWLNTFPGVFVRVDGIPGRNTADAYRQVTGSALPGAPAA